MSAYLTALLLSLACVGVAVYAPAHAGTFLYWAGVLTALYALLRIEVRLGEGE